MRVIDNQVADCVELAVLLDYAVAIDEILIGKLRDQVDPAVEDRDVLEVLGFGGFLVDLAPLL